MKKLSIVAVLLASLISLNANDNNQTTQNADSNNTQKETSKSVETNTTTTDESNSSTTNSETKESNTTTQASNEVNIPDGVKYIKMLGMALKSELQKHIKEDPSGVKAFDFCSKRAEEITKEVNSKLPEGATVRRTALKTRNPNNKPDAIDEGVMEVFEINAIEKNLSPTNIIKIPDGNYTRYYKPLLIQDVCLKCHGDNVSDELKSKIKEAYPKDMALGFKNGDFRGVIVSRVKNKGE